MNFTRGTFASPHLGTMGKKVDGRKKFRANSMGPQWWRKLSLPRRGKKETLLAPVDPAITLSDALTKKIHKRQARLRKAVEAQRVSKAKQLTVTEWDPALGMASVLTPRGNTLASMGVFSHGVQWLYPEEAVYLLDRAQLDLRVDGVPASLQRAFGVLIDGTNCLRMEEFCAFSHLRRVGYVVRRYGLDAIEDVPDQAAPSDASTDPMGAQGFPNDMMLKSTGPRADTHSGELALKPSFSVWRVGGFKRSEPHRPVFHVLVQRYEDPPPSHDDLAKLLSTCSGKTRLRVALIDRGVVTLVDIANNATPLSTRYTSRLPTPLQVPLSSGPLTGMLGVTDGLASAPEESAVISKNPSEGDGDPAQLAQAGPPVLDINVVASALKECGDMCEFEDVLTALDSSPSLDQRLRFGEELRRELHTALRTLASKDIVVLSSGPAPTIYMVKE